MKNTFVAVSMVALTTLSGVSAAAAHIRIQRDTVIPIIFEDTLRLDRNRKGDVFYAKVDDGLDLPWGTRFVGRVVSIRNSARNRPGFMDLEFNELMLPDGHRERIAAIPVRLNSRYLRKDRDGRLIGMRDDRDREAKVAGGAVGGFLLGTAFKKPLEGFILGSIAGIISAESDRREDGDLVVKSGQRMGAMFDRTSDFEWRGEFRRYRARDLEEEARIDREFRERRERGDFGRDRDDRRDVDRRDDARRDYDDIVLRYSRNTLRFDRNESPYRDGRTIMVPLRSTARQVGVEVETGRDSVSFLSSNEGTLRIETGRTEARWNGKSVQLERPVVERRGVIFVPLDAFLRLNREAIEIVGNRRDR